MQIQKVEEAVVLNHLEVVEEEPHLAVVEAEKLIDQAQEEQANLVAEPEQRHNTVGNIACT